jgi:hypothetical protein
MLADCCSSREALISKMSFRFNWSRAYSLLLTPTAFDEPVFRLPVACVAIAISNCQFKLLIPLLRVVRLLHRLPLLRVLPLR